MAEPYRNTLEYLNDFFDLLALWLHRAVLLTRLLRGGGRDEAFLGLFLSETEVDSILAELHQMKLPASEAGEKLEVEAATLEAEIKERLAATDRPLRPQQLANLFKLSPMAVELLLMLLAAEVDSRFSRVYAYLQDDVTRRWLTPGLAMQLLSGASPDEPTSRALFMPESPLLQKQLIHLGQECGSLPAPLIDRPLKLDCAIAEYLLEHDTLDPHLAGVACLFQIHEESGEPLAGRFPPLNNAPLRGSKASRALKNLPLAPDLRQQLEHLVALWRDPAAPPAFFWGRAGSGKAAAAEAMAIALDRPLLVVDSAALVSRPAGEVAAIWLRAGRQAQLNQAILYLDHLERLEASSRQVILQRLQPGLILSATTAWSFHELSVPPIMIHFRAPGYELRQQLWQQTLEGYLSLNGQSGRLAAELAGRFRLTPGQIEQAAYTAQQRAWLRSGPQAEPTQTDLIEGCRGQSNPELSRLAVKVVSPYTWADLVLPEPQLALLKAIESQVHHAHTVYHAWGFENKLAMGKGLNALFSGLSGTGKTMGAGILAKSLGLDMYKIDLSGVVSKYIGETEKNLNSIFEEASAANIVLFFDEADALFGKRSEVKDAHDRYANIEVSYLLQKMEEYEGIAILSTNFSQNLDDAFTRRMQFVIDFPFPDVDSRERIWRGLFPAAAPRGEDINFNFLAAQFELAGGNIKNCVVAAAFLSAEEGIPINMAHLIQGVARELGKLGRPLTRTHFGDYYRLARKRG